MDTDTDTDTDKVDVYMPFFVGDYLKDTTHLTCEEHGAYFKLLCTLWTKRGYLRFDHKRLALVVGLDSERWLAVWETLEPFFQVQDGLLSQKGQLRRLEESRRLKRVRRENGSKGGRASGEARRSRAGANGEANVKQTASPASSNHEANGQANGPAKTNPSPSPSPLGDPERPRDLSSTGDVVPSTGVVRPTAYDVLQWYGIAFRDEYKLEWVQDRDAPRLAHGLLEEQIGSLPRPAASAVYADIRRRIRVFLADRETSLVKNRHPFRWFCDRFNALAAAPAPKPANGGGHTRKLFTGTEPP